MKKVITIILFGILSGTYARAEFAASQSQPQKQYPLKQPGGSHYWVVETGNQSGSKYSVVRFYSPENQLLHEARQEGIHLDAGCPRTRRKLNRALKNNIKNILPGESIFRKYRL